MKPPWKAYPHFERSDLGWRMGGGEDYLAKFEEWFSQLTPDEMTEFAKNHTEPETWLGFYLQFGVPMSPPWLKHPELTLTSWEWREVHVPRVYWMTFHDWLLCLTPEAMSQYAYRNPEPDDWAGFYSSIGVRTD
jgi:hypothetical protein